MSLRREFRQQLTKGAWTWATVESTALGKATVRLAKNGARLTNLPILGEGVSVGQRVVVDYSAEGTPIVRPWTILGSELEDAVEEQEEKEQDPAQFVYAKYTISDEEINNPTMRVILNDAADGYRYSLEGGFAYGSYSGQYRYQSNFVNYIPFDEPIVDTASIMRAGYTHTRNPEGKGMFVPPVGTYIVNLTFALDITGNDLTWFGTYANLWAQVSGLTPDTGYCQNMHVNKREHHAIVKISYFAKYEGTTFFSGLVRNYIYVPAILDGAGANVFDPAWYTGGGHYSIPLLENMTYLKYAKRAGAYPLFELYKVADIGPRKTHIPYWHDNEYDYPGQ